MTDDVELIGESSFVKCQLGLFIIEFQEVFIYLLEIHVTNSFS